MIKKLTVFCFAFTLITMQLMAQQDTMMTKTEMDAKQEFAQFLKTGISVKALFMDYQTFNGGAFGSFKDYHSGFEVGINKGLTDKLVLNIPLKVGVVQSHIESNDLHKKIFALDAQLEYHMYDPYKKIFPYFLAGVGGVIEDDGTQNFQIPVGIGVNIKLFDKAYITWESAFRKSFVDKRDNFDHGLGFIYLFGKKGPGTDQKKSEEKADSDGDGIIDDIDLCPQVAGSEELSGCPDTDGDGVADYEDDCPEFSGLKSLKGCPDTDGDGISDNDDECPNMAGILSNKGCPDNKQKLDTDRDGIVDELDRCPNIFGPASNNGCPEEKKTVIDVDGDGIPDDRDQCPNNEGVASANGCPDADGDGVPDHRDACPNLAGLNVYNGCPDTDGDGIDDSRDKCPNQSGTVANSGCPDIAKRDREVLEFAMRAVQFDTGRSTLKSESNGVLNQIADIMRRYPSYDLEISGHTDNTGTASSNQNLSERRAKSCRDYLITQGISSGRMSYYGYGETRPIADNDSARGRGLNRRVEFDLSPR